MTKKMNPPSWRQARTAAQRASEEPFVTRGASFRGVRLGLKENWRQFAMLVLVNAFVGGMVGIERTVVPLVGSEEFGLVLRTAIFSFIVSFGVVKACSNLVSGVLADKYGRKKVLIAGWLIGVP